MEEIRLEEEGRISEGRRIEGKAGFVYRKPSEASDVLCAVRRVADRVRHGLKTREECVGMAKLWLFVGGQVRTVHFFLFLKNAARFMKREINL